MAREYFCAYHSYLESMEPLNDSERGRLFTALLQYSKTGVAPDLTGNERFVFYGMKSQIDRDAERYDVFMKKQRENGQKGGRPKKGESNPKNPSLFWETQKSQREGKGEGEGDIKRKEEKKKDTDAIPQGISSAPADEHSQKEKEKPKRPAPEIPAGFDRFWEAYPRKVNKQDAVKAWKKLKPGETMLEDILDGLQRWEKTAQWTKDNGQYIPYPSTFLNRRSWESDPLPKGGWHNDGSATDWDAMPDDFWR